MSRVAPAAALSASLLLAPLKLARGMLRHPLTLLLAVLLGGWAGLLWPQGKALFITLESIYRALIELATLPFLMLAVYFGVQHMSAAAAHWRRMGGLAALGLLAMLLCGLGGALVASVGGAGTRPGLQQKAALGAYTLHSSGVEAALSLHGAAAGAQQEAPPPGTPQQPGAPSGADAAALVPDNLYAAMAFGSVPSVLIGVLLFSAAVAVQRPLQANHLSALLEPLYRALELVIGAVNIGLPLIAFGLAAAATSTIGAAALGLMTGFLATWCATVLIVGAAVLALLCWRVAAGPWQVLAALRAPLTVCVCAPVGAAALPEFIEALSVRLGFGRGVVELLMSVCPVFVRTGETLFFAVLTVFLANLYGQPLSVPDLLKVGLVSCWCALCSLVLRGASGVLWTAALQAWFSLPVEAMLPLLATAGALCKGARNLVSYLTAVALLVLVGPALQATPSAPAVAGVPVPAAAVMPAPALVLVVARRQVWFSLLLLGAALGCVFGAGFGVGMRQSLYLTTL
jgi:Na+/H+-dicarboxylate symporter